VVATASPTLVLGPAEAAWLPLGRPGCAGAWSIWRVPTLRRDDQIGYVVFSSIDQLDHNLRR